MTTKLSERLRELRDVCASLRPDLPSHLALKIIINQQDLFDQCIDQAEAQRELIDEDGITGLGPVADSMYECGRMAEVMADGHTGFHAVIYPAKGIYHGSGDGYREALDDAYAAFKRGDKPHAEYGPKQQESLMEKFIARSRPSQTIGEQTPVAWRNVRRIDLRIPVRLHNALASLAMDTIGAIVDHLGVKVNDDWDGTYWRLRTALMKMRGVGRSSAIEGASAIMEAMDRPSPITPEARDRAIKAIGEAQHHLSNNRIGEVCMFLDQALSALRGDRPPTISPKGPQEA